MRKENTCNNSQTGKFMKANNGFILKKNCTNMHKYTLCFVCFFIFFMYGCSSNSSTEGSDDDYINSSIEGSDDDYINSSFEGSDDDNIEIIEKWEYIIGKWKLMKVLTMVKPMDYSIYNIVYEFNDEGILTVSGILDDIENYQGHGLGEHTYSITLYDKKNYGLKISGHPFTYGIQLVNKKLELIGNIALDDFIYYLEKIEKN